MKKLLIKFIISMVLVSGAFIVGMGCQQLLLNFSDFPERVVAYVGPIAFVIVANFSANHTDIV